MNHTPLCCGAVLLTEPHTALKTRLKDELKERQESRSLHSKISTARSRPTSFIRPPRIPHQGSNVTITPRWQQGPSRWAPHLTHHGGRHRMDRLRSLFTFSSDSAFDLSRAHFGPSDCYARLWGFIPLGIACSLLGLGVMGWGFYNVLDGWAEDWEWEGVALVFYGFFKIVFGSLVVAGVFFRVIIILYLASVFYDVFLASAIISYATSWIHWIMAFAGVGQPPWRPSWNTGISMILRETVVVSMICLTSYGWFYGVLRSLRSIITAGGTGFESLTWYEVMAQQEEMMTWVSAMVNTQGFKYIRTRSKWFKKLKRSKPPVSKFRQPAASSIMKAPRSSMRGESKRRVRLATRSSFSSSSLSSSFEFKPTRDETVVTRIDAFMPGSNETDDALPPSVITSFHQSDCAIHIDDHG
eukprot:Blabericola_migrator_1__5499@NODE_2805_length_2334_cov_48_613586_g1757_i0_p1_GENE_NODE_2805_length_2334_cov_48_613586_g1757_i0NODE_2805_length_2334_cov_48_613586_g1757_i0_p1_ORF_typecomplete_len413_score42_66Gate/PF07670_14/0_081YlbE/PF14003_6/0_2DUF2070/PF09843_9/10_NODE_2805_length_2334_cov_48_613586_g1757_i010322270